MSLFTTRTFFGSPLDVTLEELCIELFYPADVASEALLRQHGALGLRRRAINPRCWRSSGTPGAGRARRRSVVRWAPA